MEAQLYIGTKALKAWPMARGEYNTYRDWVVPENEQSDEEGYLVEYLDGGEPNDKRYEGYISWSPANVFEASYKKSGEMSFGMALEALKKGFKVARTGWNGKGMFLFLVQGSTFNVNRPPLLGIYPEGTEINYHSHVDMKAADGTIVPWNCSQSDMLANDWCVLE